MQSAAIFPSNTILSSVHLKTPNCSVHEKLQFASKLQNTAQLSNQHSLIKKPTCNDLQLFRDQFIYYIVFWVGTFLRIFL